MSEDALIRKLRQGPLEELLAYMRQYPERLELGKEELLHKLLSDKGWTLEDFVTEYIIPMSPNDRDYVIYFYQKRGLKW